MRLLRCRVRFAVLQSIRAPCTIYCSTNGCLWCAATSVFTILGRQAWRSRPRPPLAGSWVFAPHTERQFSVWDVLKRAARASKRASGVCLESRLNLVLTFSNTTSIVDRGADFRLGRLRARLAILHGKTTQTSGGVEKWLLNDCIIRCFPSLSVFCRDCLRWMREGCSFTAEQLHAN